MGFGSLRRASKDAMAAFRANRLPILPVYAFPALCAGEDPRGWDRGPSNPQGRACQYALLSADLGKPLSEAFGKCDGTVPGKYRRARVFAFETESCVLLAVVEPGDRGSGWYAARKADGQGDQPDSMEVGKLERTWSDGDLSELAGAFRGILAGLLETDSDVASELRQLAPGLSADFVLERKSEEESRRLLEDLPKGRSRVRVGPG